MSSLSAAESHRGALIVLEGVDRAGKTIQSEKLLDYFRSQGKAARIQRFPDRSEPKTGPSIDAFLHNANSIVEDREAIHLLFSANRWSHAKKIRDEVNRGVNLILDRYSFSGVAYSLAKELDKSWACIPEVGLPRPDIVLFFDIDPAIASTRGGFGDEVLERSDFQKSVYKHMKEIGNEAYWQKINATETVEQVFKSVTEKVDTTLKAVADGKPVETIALIDFGLY